MTPRKALRHLGGQVCSNPPARDTEPTPAYIQKIVKDIRRTRKRMLEETIGHRTNLYKI